MALNTSRCNHLMPLCFKVLNYSSSEPSRCDLKFAADVMNVLVQTQSS